MDIWEDFSSVRYLVSCITTFENHHKCLIWNFNPKIAKFVSEGSEGSNVDLWRENSNMINDETFWGIFKHCIMLHSNHACHVFTLVSQSTLFEKSNFCPKIQFWQKPNIFTSFSPKFFWQFFSWNRSCQQLKSPKPQHFH